MKYGINTINSDNICDFYNDSSGITFRDLDKPELDFLVDLSLKHGYSIEVFEHKKEG